MKRSITLSSIVLTTLGTILNPTDTNANPFLNWIKDSDHFGNIGVKSKYMAPPGYELERQPTLQSTLRVSNSGLYGYTWGNINLRRGTLTEYDLGVGYSRSWRNVTADLSYNFFDLIDQGDGRVDDNMHELWLVLSTTGLPFRIKVSQNIAAGSFPDSRGRDVSFRLNHDAKMRGAPISIGGEGHLNNNYFTSGTSISVIQARATVPIQYRGRILKPTFEYQRAINRRTFDDSFVASIVTDF